MSKIRPRRWPGVLAAGLVAAVGFGKPLVAAPAAAGPGPLYREATNEFAAMRTTLYQHRTQVDRAAGRYDYDCVGFVSYALKQAAPVAWASTVKALGLAKGRIPSPPRYRTFFAGLVQTPQPGWEAVTNAADLHPGDVVAWEHKTETSSGHALILGGLPVRRAEGEWLVEVYDSTSSPHGEDSRRTDARAQILATTGRPSGLGQGLVVLMADPASGALTGVRWGPKSKGSTFPIAAARPTE